MIPCELSLRNFMCYRDNLPPLCLDGLHIACLSGENGAGKSALLDAITWAIWGKARMSDDDLIAQGESEMQVDLRFQLDGQRYRVIRQRKRGKSGTRTAGKSTLDFQIQGELGWRPIGDGKISETERSIENLLRMKYETFINASMLLQGRADEFTRKSPAERKQVLADILDLGEYATLENRAKDRVKHLNDEIKGIEGLIEHLQQQAEKLAVYTTMVEAAAARAATLATELEAAEAAHQEAETQVQALETHQKRRKEVSAELTKLRGEQQRQEQEIAELHVQIGTAEALLQRQEEIHAGMAALQQAQQELKRLEGLRPRFDALWEQRRQHQDALREEKRTLQRELDKLKHTAQELINKIARRPTIQAEQGELEQRLAALSPLQKQLQTVRTHLDDCDQRIAQTNALLLKRSDLAGQIKLRQDSLVSVREEQQRSIERCQRDLRDVARWQADLETALKQQQMLDDLTTQLATRREQEQTDSMRLGELRAQCSQFKQQADQIKKDRDRLSSADTTVCPVCRSELGSPGISSVLEHYDQEITELRERYRTYQREAKTLEQELAQTSTEIKALNEQMLQAQGGAARIASLQENLAKAHAWQTELEAAQLKLADVQRQLDAADYAPDIRAELLTIEDELAVLAPETGERPRTKNRELRTENRELRTENRYGKTVDIGQIVLDGLNRERAGLRQQHDDLEKQLTTLPNLLSGIETCRRELADLDQAATELPGVEAQVTALDDRIERNDFAHAIRVAGRAVEGELAALGYSVEAHNAASTEVEQLARWAEEERRLHTAQIRLEGDRRMLQQATELRERRAVDIDQLTREEALLEQELRALPTARQRAHDCRQTVNEQRKALDVAQRDLHEKQMLHTQAQEAVTQLAEQRQRRDRRCERQAIFQELADAFGKKGVQAMLIETAIPEIEHEANRLLGRMTDNQMHLTFEMQREKKQGGGAIETLDIKIADALGTRIYDAFSGGEAMRVNFAIRVALSRLLARRAGASLETLVIDEGFGTLDAQGRERFVEAITGVQHDFKRILVITHLEELKERFPAQIEITKTAQGSVWTLI